MLDGIPGCGEVQEDWTKWRKRRKKRVSDGNSMRESGAGRKHTRIDEVFDHEPVLAYVSMRQCDDVFHPMTDKLFSERSRRRHAIG